MHLITKILDNLALSFVWNLSLDLLAVIMFECASDNVPHARNGFASNINLTLFK